MNPTRRLFTFLVAILFATAALAADESIREFPIPTIVALGKELYLRDHLAATAFDTLFEAQPEAQKLPLKGWITQLEKDNPRVFFIQEQNSKLSLAYTVAFPKQGAPKIEDQHGAALPEYVATRYEARRAAIAAIPKFMTKSYNFEVLDAPDGKGFLVYGLASTQDPNEVIMGGHYRVSVTPEGKVQQVDALSRSLLILKKHSPDMPKGTNAAAFSMSHVVSKTPVESHVFVSLLHKIPLFVATGEETVWMVNDGEITKAKAKD